MPGSENDNCNSFFNAIFYAVSFNIEQTTECCSSEKLKETIDSNLFIQLNQEKFNISLDYQKFHSQCHEINMILTKTLAKQISSSSIKKSQKNKILLDNYLVV